jgi:4'-phosphopantetheinyl transferase
VAENRIASNIDFTLRRKEVHVRAVWLNSGPATGLACRAVLSGAEIERADRFAFEHLTRAYEVAHGALRLLLAVYLQCAPVDVEFTVGPRGKPEFRKFPWLRFNMAHSRDLALYAFASDCAVGIDVEEIREMPDLESVALNYFCRAQTEELLSIRTSAARSDAFFRCWTRKEAYIKAVGEGLYLPLDEFQVTLREGDPARFVHIGNDVKEAERWNLHDVDLASNYTGALAYRGGSRQLDVFGPIEVGELIDGPRLFQRRR